MTPSFIGLYAIIFPGVRPIISFASFPTARILLSATETATTDGSLSTIPLPGTKTRTVVVPRSMPSFGENENDIYLVRALYTVSRMEYRTRCLLRHSPEVTPCPHQLRSRIL